MSRHIYIYDLGEAEYLSNYDRSPVTVAREITLLVSHGQETRSRAARNS